MCVICAEVATGAVAITGLIAQKLNRSPSMARFKARFSPSIEAEETISVGNLADAQKAAGEPSCI
jgi:hypothetical protein